MLVAELFPVEHLIYVLVFVVLTYFSVGTWLAPLVTLATPRDMIRRVDLPAHVRHIAKNMGVNLYLVPDLTDGGANPGSYACSCWLGFERAVLVDRTFFNFAPWPAVEFVLTHELGHHWYGHPLKRLLITMIRANNWRCVHNYLARQEDEANLFAERITGYQRSIVWPVHLPQSVLGGPEQFEEKPQ